MLLGVIPKLCDCLLEAGLDQSHGGEGHTTPTSSLALDRTDVAQTNRVVGGGKAGQQSIISTVLLLGIIIIGYRKTTKEGDFIVRGLRSLVTTGQLN